MDTESNNGYAAYAKYRERRKAVQPNEAPQPTPKRVFGCFNHMVADNLAMQVEQTQRLCTRLYETAPSTDQDLIEAVQACLDDAGRLLFRLNRDNRSHMDEVANGP